MQESKKSKPNRRRLTKDGKQRIAMIFVILLIVAYVVAELYGIFNSGLKLQTAVISTVYDTISTNALVVRDEHTVTSDKNAVTVASVSDCEKVKNGGEIAKVFSSAESAQAYSQYAELESELKYYANMESQAVGQATDVESLDKDILQNINEYIRAAEYSQIETAQDYSSELNDKFTRRQILVGKQIDFSTVMKDVESQMQAVDVSSAKPVGYINADSSGIFSTYSDGLESAFDYSKVETLDSETLSQWIEQAKTPAETQGIGKIITSFDWYFCASVSADAVTGLENGDYIDVAVSGTDRVYSCEIVTGAEPELSAETTVLVLMCDDMNSDVASMRLADIELRINSYTGIKMPSSAVHVNENGQKGVYALVGSVVEWRYTEVLYDGGNYVLLKYYTAQDKEEAKKKAEEQEKNGDADASTIDLTIYDNGIKIYDEIIIQGKELHDGKVYT